MMITPLVLCLVAGVGWWLLGSGQRSTPSAVAPEMKGNPVQSGPSPSRSTSVGLHAVASSEPPPPNALPIGPTPGPLPVLNIGQDIAWFAEHKEALRSALEKALTKIPSFAASSEQRALLSNAAVAAWRTGTTTTFEQHCAEVDALLESLNAPPSTRSANASERWLRGTAWVRGCPIVTDEVTALLERLEGRAVPIPRGLGQRLGSLVGVRGVPDKARTIVVFFIPVALAAASNGEPIKLEMLMSDDGPEGRWRFRGWRLDSDEFAKAPDVIRIPIAE